MLRKIIAVYARLTRFVVLPLLREYGVRINTHVQPQGQHPVVVHGGEVQKQRNIPRTTYCNTRSGQITIGKHAMFGEDVKLLTGKHFANWEADGECRFFQGVPESGRDIHIEEGVYLGSGVIVVGPVRVGRYSVIGCGSVVTKDIPPFSFAAGVPAKVIRRFETESEHP